MFTGQNLTYPIEQDNSNIRHYLARCRHKAKVMSKSHTVIDLSLRLLHHLQIMRLDRFYIASATAIDIAFDLKNILNMF